MNVAIIGSDDTLLGAAGIGDAVSRHRRYGDYLDHLDIILYTDCCKKYKNFEISPNVTAYASNSWAKLLFFIDALLIFRKIWRTHHIDLVIAKDPFYFGLIGCWLKLFYGVRFIVHFHGDFWENPAWRREHWFNPLLLLISFFIVHFADGIRVVSHTIESKLLRHGISKERIAVIPTPVDAAWLTSYDPRGVVMLRERYVGRRIVLFVGRLVEVKNIPFLLHVFNDVRREVPEALLLIAGDGPEEANSRKIIHSFELDKHVEFLGLCSREALARYYQIADVVVLTSFSEGLPKVLVEAAACGKPLISTVVSGADELIQDGENGFLISQGDERLFALKLVTLFRDEHLRQSMGEVSRKIVVERFCDTTERVVDFWRKIVVGS